MIHLGKDTNVKVSLAVPGSVILDLNQHILSQFRCDSHDLPGMLGSIPPKKTVVASPLQ